MSFRCTPRRVLGTPATHFSKRTPALSPQQKNRRDPKPNFVALMVRTGFPAKGLLGGCTMRDFIIKIGLGELGVHYCSITVKDACSKTARTKSVSALCRSGTLHLNTLQPQIGSDFASGFDELLS